MNTHIARMLNKSLLAEMTGKDVVAAHNNAVQFGFLQLPHLDYIDTHADNHSTAILVAPTAGLATINDIYNIKIAWGADEVNVYTGTNGSIEFLFKKKEA